MQPDVLDDIAQKQEDSEYFSSIPEGYVKGKTKFIITLGTVMSGLGKGIFSSSLAKLMKFKGLNVSPIKFEGYINIDSGTLNPYRHGEVFVLNDGMETDMDLGTYERYLEQDLNSLNFTTNGQLFTKILKKEREGKYLGRDIQFIPHVTGEIKFLLRELAMKSSADVVFVEIGGTVGDIENSHYIEAMRELAYEEGKENVAFLCLTYVLEPAFLGEQKSKAAQLGIKTLMEKGIQPDIVACRAVNEVTEKVKQKISITANVKTNMVFSAHDVKNLYRIPLALKDAKIDEAVVELLDLKDRIKPEEEEINIKKWSNFIEQTRNLEKNITIGITGKYTGLRDSYASIIHALDHAGYANSVKINIKWIDTTNENNINEQLKDVNGIIVPGGFGTRGIEGKISCIKYARENNLPYLGLCYGFQMALVEFARNVMNLDADSTEVNQDTKNPVICLLPEQMKIEGLGGNMRLGEFDIDVKENTIAHKLYGSINIRERFRHRFECNPEYVTRFEENGMIFSGKKHDIMKILELPEHKFFVGTQAHPEFKSKPSKPSPFYLGFVKACME